MKDDLYPSCKELDCNGWFKIKPLIQKDRQVKCFCSLSKVLGENKIDFNKEKIFLEKCKNITKSDVFEGAFVKPFVLDLINYDIKLKLFVKNNGRIAPITYEKINNHQISNKKDIEFRKILCYYIYSDLSLEELNVKFKGGFVKEGEIPIN